MAWVVVLLAGVLEVGWAVGLKSIDVFARPWTAVSTVLCMIASIALLAVAMRTLPLGTAYAVWTGIGAVGTAVAGVVLFGESAALPRLACIGLIAIGTIGLKVFPSA